MGTLLRYRDNDLRMAQMLRAHRKHMGLDQADLARELGIQQSTLSRMESGRRQIHPSLWLELCDRWELPYDCYKKEYLDLSLPVTLRDSATVGKYRIPSRYAHEQGSTMRTARLFRNYAADRLGQGQADWLIQQNGMDPDFLVHAHHQANYRFLVDYLGLLCKHTPIRSEIQALVKPLSAPASHGALAEIYDRTVEDGFSAVQALIANASNYDVNFRYQIEDLERDAFDVSAQPEKHLSRFREDCEDAGVGRLLCEYKAAFIAQFSTYGGMDRLPVSVSHPEEHCIFSGADRCVYRVGKAS